jgi:hypothetical protein
MNNTFAAAALAAALTLTAAAASGQPAPAAPDSAAPPAAAAPAQTTGPSVDWTYGQLMADPASKTVLTRDIPSIVGFENQDQIQGMTIRQFSQYPQSGIDAAKLDTIQADLTTAAAAPKAAP